MRWVLKGEKGAVQFLVYMNWHLPHVIQEQIERAKHSHDLATDLKLFWQPMAADLGYHSKVPMYGGQEPIGSVNTEINMDSSKEGLEKFDFKRTETGTFTPCPYLDGAPCYYDGSGLHAEKVLAMLIKKGGEAVWQHMEKCYHEQFDQAPVSAENLT
jgi:hypothetical protein